MTAKEKVLSRVPDAVIRYSENGGYHVCSDELNLVLANWITEEIAWKRALSRLDSIVILPCGVAIRDDRDLGLGLGVLSNGIKQWVRLSYSGDNKFHISTTGTRLNHDEVDDYIAQLQFIKQACIEANQHFNK